MVIWHCSVVLLVDSEQYNTTGFVLVQVFYTAGGFQIQNLCHIVVNDISQGVSLKLLLTGRFLLLFVDFYNTHPRNTYVPWITFMRVSKEYDHESWGCLIEKARASQIVRGVKALDQYDKSPSEKLL